jgi:hypothetical protein
VATELVGLVSGFELAEGDSVLGRIGGGGGGGAVIKVVGEVEILGIIGALTN